MVSVLSGELKPKLNISCVVIRRLAYFYFFLLVFFLQLQEVTHSHVRYMCLGDVVFHRNKRETIVPGKQGPQPVAEYVFVSVFMNCSVFNMLTRNALSA